MKRSLLCYILFAVIATMFLLSIPVIAQQEDDNQNKILERVKIKDILKRSRRKRSTHKNSRAANIKSTFSNRLIAFTLWRVIKKDNTNNSDEAQNVLDFESINLDTPLAANDELRVTIEIPRRGYLYVIDSEVYSDGEKNAKLIFPTNRINNGDNRIAPAQPVGIPNIEDSPPFFTLNLKKDQQAENLRILVTSKPLTDLNIGDKPQALSIKDFEALKKFEVKVEKIELGRVNKLQSKAEQQAEFGNRAKKELEHTSPLPQSAFLAATDSGDSIMTVLTLKLAPAK